jgi:predicted nucleic acid-binding protein
VAALVDTNVLIYRFDVRYPEKQKIATRLLLDGLTKDTVRIPHQAIVEFVSVVSRPGRGTPPLLSEGDAWHEAEKFLVDFPVLYPTAAVVRTAIRGAAAYRLSWFDAHLWAYADVFGCGEILTEDFQHGRLYGTVKAVDPFL